MKKCTACAFSSTKKDRRPKKPTTLEMATNMDCQPLGGGGGGLAGSYGPGHQQRHPGVRTEKELPTLRQLPCYSIVR